MTVHEIVKWLANGDDTIDLPTVERDIRAAVIREVSVGTVKLSHNGVASDYDIIPKETP